MKNFENLNLMEILEIACKCEEEGKQLNNIIMVEVSKYSKEVVNEVEFFINEANDLCEGLSNFSTYGKYSDLSVQFGDLKLLRGVLYNENYEELKEVSALLGNEDSPT